MKIALDLTRDGYYIVRPTHLTWDEIEFHSSETELPLETLQALVEGYIECIFISGVADGIVNEEGKLKSFAPNPLATSLYANSYDHIVGTMVILCGKARLS